jgi:hypothetical protein
MRIAATSLALTIGLAGCTKYTFDIREPENVKEVNRVVAAGKPTPADVLFVVDNSGSMADEQENLARNFAAFINEIAGAGDYQLAVVTTDLDSPTGERGGRVTVQYKSTAPFAIQGGLNVSACMDVGIEHGCFRGPDPGKRIISSALPKQEQIDGFATNVLVGSCGSGTEKGLDAMIRALERSESGDCNQGFLRPGSNLVVVIVSDEEDSDAPGLNPPSVDSYITALRRFKDPSQTRVAIVVGERGGDGARCGAMDTCGGLCNQSPPASSNMSCTPGAGATCPQGEVCQPMGAGGQCQNEDARFWQYCWWCSYYNTPDCCSANAGRRYVEFAKKMETAIAAGNPDIEPSGCQGAAGSRIACLIDSICQEQFDRTLSRIAKDLVLLNDFNLDPPAKNPNGIVVKIDGVELVRCNGTNDGACDFNVTVDSTTGYGTKLTIIGEKTPKEGQNVEIYYLVDDA